MKQQTKFKQQPCISCGSRQTYLRNDKTKKSKERVCRSCGNVEQLKEIKK